MLHYARLFAKLGALVSISDVTAEGYALSPNNATANYRLLSTGAGDYTPSGAFTWRLLGASADYEVRATNTGGVPPTTGTLDTWQSLSTSSSWSLTETGIGPKSSTLLIEIRRVSDGAILDSATITLFVLVDS